MRYALLIYGSEAAMATATEAETQAEFDAYNSFTKEIVDRGLMQGGEALQPTSTATTVQVRNGETLTTDGPFAETKEQLGGFYLVDCRDLDEAIATAAKIPGAKSGSIEVRPIMEIPPVS
ncbi:MAG TPA: YciI family protein [Actinomycetota bacterium]